MTPGIPRRVDLLAFVHLNGVGTSVVRVLNRMVLNEQYPSSPITDDGRTENTIRPVWYPKIHRFTLYPRHKEPAGRFGFSQRLYPCFRRFFRLDFPRLSEFSGGRFQRIQGNTVLKRPRLRLG